MTRSVPSTVAVIDGAVAADGAASNDVLGELGELGCMTWLFSPNTAFTYCGRTPLSMFTGRKDVPLPSTPHFWLRATLTLALAVGAVALVNTAHRWLS